MTALMKRLDALEHQARQTVVRDAVVSRFGPIAPRALAAKTVQVGVLYDRMERMAAEGGSLHDMARLVAEERGLDPDRVVTILTELRAKYGR